MADRGRRGVGAAAVAVRAASAAWARPLGAPALPRWPTLPVADWFTREAEQRRLFPWLPVAFGVGVLLFFAAEGRSTLWAPLVGAAVAGGSAVALRRSAAGFAAAVGVLAVFLGFAAGVLRLRHVEAPVLDRVTIGVLSGFVEVVEDRIEGARVLIRVHAIAGVGADRQPRRVRVTLRDARGLVAGAFVAGNARLLPLPEAVRPGGYDFARDAYFQGIGAVGSFLAKPELRPAPVDPGWTLRLAAAIDDARNALTRRIAAAIGGPAGAVTAALVTGKRGFIDEDTNEILRGAGIYHIVSISGLHMVLAAGAFFSATRALLALSPALALGWPVKKIAAVVGMVGATAYCVFAGAEVATERSLVMTLVMFGAILADRPALSIRNVAIAALIVLAREPETLLGPSFQMSFGAVTALVAFANSPLMRRGERGGTDPVSRALRWLRHAAVATLGTTLVAGLATAPFSAYHFQTANPLGLIGNALALPLVTLVVMPAAVIGALAVPFGLDRPLWQVTGWAVEKVLDVSAWVSGLSGATVGVPAFGPGALALLALALLCATLFVSPLRLLALAPAAAGFLLASHPGRPDLFIDRSGAGAAYRAADGRLAVVGRPSGFVVEQWLRADGDRRAPDDLSLRAGAGCDALGCVAKEAAPGRRSLAVVNDRRAFIEDCGRAAVIVSRLDAPTGCRAAYVFDRAYLNRHGATSVRFPVREDDTGAVVEHVRRLDEDRPWLSRAEAAGPHVPSPPSQRRSGLKPGRDPVSGSDDGPDDAPANPDQ